MSGIDFDVVHNVAQDYFLKHVPHMRDFTHHVGMLDEQKAEANFFLYCNGSDQFNFLIKLKN